MFNSIESPNRLKRSSRVSIRRKMRKTRSVLRIRSSNSRRMLRRGSRTLTRPNRSSRRRSVRRGWRVSNLNIELVNSRTMSIRESRS